MEMECEHGRSLGIYCKDCGSVEDRVSKSRSNAGVMPLFDKHNDNLVWLVGHLSFLNVTQKRLNDKDYNKALKILKALRIDLYEGKA